MNEIKLCTYSMDDGALEIDFVDGRKMIILVHDLTESLCLSALMESKFIWLLYNEPQTLAELYLSGELEGYLEWWENSQHKQKSGILSQLEQRYDFSIAQQIAREFMMYDN